MLSDVDLVKCSRRAGVTSASYAHLHHHALIPEKGTGQRQSGWRPQLKAVTILGWPKHHVVGVLVCSSRLTTSIQLRILTIVVNWWRKLGRLEKLTAICQLPIAFNCKNAATRRMIPTARVPR